MPTQLREQELYDGLADEGGHCLSGMHPGSDVEEPFVEN